MFPKKRGRNINAGEFERTLGTRLEFDKSSNSRALIDDSRFDSPRKLANCFGEWLVTEVTTESN